VTARFPPISRHDVTFGDDDAGHGGDDAQRRVRLASPTGIYGGTLEIFRNMIAQHALGLGRPNHSPVNEKS
jgi:hypothetical protein